MLEGLSISAQAFRSACVTITKLVEACKTCMVCHDAAIHNVKVKRLQVEVDEIWSFSYAD